MDQQAKGESMTIHVGGKPLVDVLTKHGWVQGAYETGDGVCLHGAIRRCQPVPGDAVIIETVETRLDRWSTEWNDHENRTEGEVLNLAEHGWDITDADLAAVFGPQWKAVVALIRRTAVLTPDEIDRLVAAWNAAEAADEIARDAALDAAWDAARDAARGAARDAARNAALDATWDVAVAGRDAASFAAVAVATWDLATDTGPYTAAHSDLLVAPWRQVIGEPTDLVNV